MPPIPQDVVRFQLRYVFGAEIAVNTFHCHVSGPTSDWGAMTQKAADKVRDVWASNWGNLAGILAQYATLQRVDAYHLRDTDGLTMDKRTSLFAGGGLKGTATGMLPPEVALAVSLYGYDPAVYDPNGARKRGRIYLPFVGTNQATGDGFVGGAQGVANFYATTFSALNGVQISGISVDNPAGPVHMNPVILSRKYASMAGVQVVRCDNLFDVQKRRQNNLLVQPKFAPLTVIPS